MKKIKRATALVMAGVMCVSFAGCGKKKKQSKEEIVPYKLTQLAEIDKSIDNVICDNQVIYGSFSTYDENNGEEKIGIIKYDFNSNEKNEVSLDLTSGYIHNIYINSEGNLVVNAEKYLENPSFIDEETDDDVESGNSEAGNESEDVSNENSNDDSDENNSSDEESSDSNDDSFASDGEEDYYMETSEVTYVFDTSLELISRDEKDVDENVNVDEWLIDTIIDNDGNTIELKGTDDGENYIRCVDSEGNETKKINIDPDIYIQDILKLEDGTILVSVWAESGQEEIYKVDLEGEKLGDKYVNADNMYMLSGIYAGKENSLIINFDGYLCVCDGTSGNMTKVLKYIDCDLAYDNIQFVCAVGDDSYAVVLNDYESETSEIDLLSKQNREDVVVKEEIHFAALDLDDDIKQKIIQFNKTNDTYRIVIDEYLDSESYMSETGYNDAIKRMNADILSGSIDIIDMSSLDMSQYASKGIIEDLLPYMEKDEDINVEDFLDSIVEAYTIDGKLYALPTYFSLMGFAGSTNMVGTETTWTIQEFIEFVKGLPEGMDVLDGITSDSLLTMMLRCDMDEYVNWSEGTCSFNTDEFVALLELCSNYKSSEEMYAEYEEMDDEDWENQPSEITKIRNNKLALYQTYLNDADEYLVMKEMFGTDFTVKGCPTKNKNGILISGSGELSICSKSNYKDIAWDFIKQLYSYEEIKDNMWNFPIRKDALDEFFEELKNRPLDKAPDGTEYYTMWSMNDVDLYLGNPTDEDIEKIKEIIGKADTVIKYSDDEILDMIQEEAESFFKGEKTANDVADIIQSRASIYVQENK